MHLLFCTKYVFVLVLQTYYRATGELKIVHVVPVNVALIIELYVLAPKNDKLESATNHPALSSRSRSAFVDFHMLKAAVTFLWKYSESRPPSANSSELTTRPDRPPNPGPRHNWSKTCKVHTEREIIPEED